VLVVLGPPFGATDAEYAVLASVTGLLPYELKTKIKIDAWGVVRVFADASEAERLARELYEEGFTVALLDPALASDRSRLIVPVDRLELAADDLTLPAAEQVMTLPYSTIASIVKGELRVGQGAGRATSVSGSGWRALTPSAEEVAAFRESPSGTSFDALPVLDIHFHSVLWAARVDARSFDFSCLPVPLGRPAENLEQLARILGEKSGARVDRAARTSSLASFAARPTALRHSNPPLPSVRPAPASDPPGRSAPPQLRPTVVASPFDSYSRFVAEAERQRWAAT